MEHNFKIHSFTLEHPETGEQFDFVMGAYENYEPGTWTHSNGDPGDPPVSEREYDDWWEEVSMDKPLWVTEEMLIKELDKIDFT
jgi:hypothetical protein